MDILIELIKNQKHYTKKVNYLQKLNIGTKSKCEAITLTTPAEKKEEENKMTLEELRKLREFKDVVDNDHAKEIADEMYILWSKLINRQNAEEEKRMRKEKLRIAAYKASLTPKP